MVKEAKREGGWAAGRVATQDTFLAEESKITGFNTFQMWRQRLSLEPICHRAK